METTKLVWIPYPAVSSNRSFYEAKVNNHRWSVVYFFNGLWTCLIDDCVVNSFNGKKKALAYFQGVFDAI